MSNSIIPHLLSDSPPPIASNVDEDYDDEFGDFRGPGDLSFDNDLSTPSTPKNSKHHAENYSTFKIDEIENNYEINIKRDDTSTKNFIRNELPTKNYINILDHIENNAPKIVNRDKEDILNVNIEIENELKDSSSAVKVHSECEENKTNSCTENILVTKSFDDNKHIGKDSGTLTTQNNSTDKSDNIGTSDEDKLKKKPVVTILNWNEVPSEDISADIDEVFLDSKDYFVGDSSVYESVIIDCNNELGTEKKKPRNGEASIENLKTRDDFPQCGNEDVNILKACEIETSNCCSLSTVIFGSVEEESELNCCDKLNNINEFGNYDDNSNNLNEDVHVASAKNASLNLFQHTRNILSATLKEIAVDNSTEDNPQVDECKASENSGDDDDFGEFGDFKTATFDGTTDDFVVPFEVEDVKQVKDDYTEFGNFENYNHSEKLENFSNFDKSVDVTEEDEKEQNRDPVVDDELDDFADYSTFAKPQEDTDDDFDNFCDYSTFEKRNSENTETAENTIQICKGPEEALQRSQCILEEMFVSTSSDTTDYNNCDVTLGNSVFENLKDITETNALMYQWEKSTAQKNILKTLNIDIRNILYGPSWNSGVPIFAANLCSTPLEPIKSELSHPLSPHKTLQTPEADCSNLSTDVPLAEFDWNGAGLTNPLDSFENVEKQPETSDLSKSANNEFVIPYVGTSANSVPSRPTFNDQKDNGAVDYLQCIPYATDKEVAVEAANEDEFGDFASCQPKNQPEIEWTNKMLPLRESHISFQPSSVVSDQSSISQASIKPNNEKLTSLKSDSNFLEWKPDCSASRGKVYVPETWPPVAFDDSRFFHLRVNLYNKEKPIAQFNDFESFKRNQPNPATSSTSNSSDPFLHNFSNVLEATAEEPRCSGYTPENSDYREDEFTDFRSSSPDQPKLPLSSASSFPEPLNNKDKPIAQFNDFKSFKGYQLNPATSSTSNSSDPFLRNFSNVLEATAEDPSCSGYTPENSDYREDEFTDFRSSSPDQPKLPLSSASSFPEPLMPSVLQPIPLADRSVAKIEWPEPGIDDDEIGRIVAGCLRRKSETEVGTLEKKEASSCREKTMNSKKAIAPRKVVSSNDDDEWSDFVSVKEPVKSRTSTPDLPLSVFNLGSIQPVKAPTPVVMPNGLICSPVKNASSNVPVPKSNVNFQRNAQHHPQKQHPFITSQAFDALYQNPRKNIASVNNSFGEAPRQVVNQPNSNCETRYLNTTSPSVANIGYVPSPNGAVGYGRFQSSDVADEEWGDFVSATSVMSPYNSNLNSVQSGTRIITNPSHSMGAFNKNVSSEQYPPSNRSTVVRQERRNIPSISALPDLDFVSPRARGVRK